MATATTLKLTEHSKPLNNTEDDILLDYDFRLSSYTLGFSQIESVEIGKNPWKGWRYTSRAYITIQSLPIHFCKIFLAFIGDICTIMSIFIPEILLSPCL